MQEIHVSARSVRSFESLLGGERMRALEARAEELRPLLGQRAIWNINSTASGGGVAEMLRSLLRYARGLQIDVRWLVLAAPPEFFGLTKRLHNALHGSAGDGSPLGPEQAALFTRVTQENAGLLHTLIRRDDIVICHDPQTAGLVPILLQRGALVVWRCHIGHEQHENPEVDRGWEFLRPYLQDIPLAVFSRTAYAPAWLRGKRTIVVAPNIDPLSAKSQLLDQSTIQAILTHVGLVAGSSEHGTRLFSRDDGSTGRVDRQAETMRVGHAPSWETPLVVQVSRWDAMKDPVGVLRGFTKLLTPEAPKGAHLVLAGPSVHSVADDPEGAKVFGELQQVFLALPPEQRAYVHLAALPMEDGEENAAIVNALQRHAAVIVQKSLVEGFGLTVTEALWKRRPVVASAVGGILDQIRDGIDGLLVHDPKDLEEFAGLLKRVLSDDRLSDRLGQAGHDRVRENYLCVTALERWQELLQSLLERVSRPGLRESQLESPAR
jgi:trehalose synthase